MSEQDTFSTIRFFAIGIQDSAAKIREAAESARDNGDEMTGIDYVWYLHQISELIQTVGNLAFVTSEVRRNSAAKEMRGELVAK